MTLCSCVPPDIFFAIDRLEHIISRRNIHTHQEPAPVSKKQYQVTGYGENGTGDANDVWRVEIVGGSEGDKVHTVTSRIKLVHYFMKCVLTSSGKQLPKWGYEQVRDNFAGLPKAINKQCLKYVVNKIDF